MPLIFGQTSSGLMVPVLVEADGALQPNNKGYIGAAWQKNPLALGYSGSKSEQKSDTSAAAGTNVLTSTAVPAGEIWIVEVISARNAISASTKILLTVVVDTVNIIIEDHQTPGISEFVIWTGAITLSEGDTVNANFYGCILNDDIYMLYHARRIDIDQ